MLHDLFYTSWDSELRKGSIEQYYGADSSDSTLPSSFARAHIPSLAGGFINTPDLVVGLDSSTQSVKVIAWDRQGHAVASGRAPIPMSSPQPHWMEQDPEDWWRSLCSALGELWTQIEPERVGAVSIANQRETLGLLDAQGRATRPAITWLDERARDSLEVLARDFGAQKLHFITGRPLDLTPALCRMVWLREHEPEVYARTSSFVDVSSYLNLRLCGHLASSWASCDPLGTFDIHSKTWSKPILDYLGLGPEQFAQPKPPGTLIGKIQAGAARETGFLEGTPLIAGGGDGQCAALGTGCTAPGRAYVNLGTALVFGVWSSGAQMNLHWRTLLSGSGQGYLLETVQRTGAYLITWFLNTFMGGQASPEIFAALEREASALPIGSGGLITLPYFSGCMNPHWDPDARGCLIGLGSGHGRAHIYRSILEGVALETAGAVQAMREGGIGVEQITAIGGGSSSPLWVQMFADALGQDLWLSDTQEASALGAGMLAALGMGWFETPQEASAAMRGPLRRVPAQPHNAPAYARLLELQSKVYASNAAHFKTLAEIRRGGHP